MLRLVAPRSAAGRWEDARAAFEAALAEVESAEARFGLASALWWLGENERSVAECTTAYSLFRRAGDVEHAVQCALWLGITYKANFANFAAANGWIGRADRLLEPIDAGAAARLRLGGAGLPDVRSRRRRGAHRAGLGAGAGPPTTSISSSGRCPSSG